MSRVFGRLQNFTKGLIGDNPVIGLETEGGVQRVRNHRAGISRNVAALSDIKQIHAAERREQNRRCETFVGALFEYSENHQSQITSGEMRRDSVVP